MFGVPFGPEIDMWSLGCILAEVSFHFVSKKFVNKQIMEGMCLLLATWTA